MREGLGYGVSAGIGAAVGFGALGALYGAGLALLASALAVLATTGFSSREVRGFMATHVTMAHAAAWCLALVIAALVVRA